ncbi:Upf3p CYBJADRAFT_172731 [Cyberlindnera jadinii NRRL Y-1542]|uniref:UPF3 domain-containing protein n=1 Tax=Cyberlindnera jadinii (strain ATCC 18201 / CBS 1600 / BCRC 20928 / JCM 3617 / NBRC 0987 / NRRL Y-1542) TaxID=983966 RepID=A0A1E4S3E3_CYBJN|nr:hypothetical protein CYBJADRAFT_172731 [Cyberlindnera jadinii NRRL Y-1542]ODV73970.1 hypothetical protein CYBJADRAFT_172731 [Cyberlindnera jadinii NRRL Y-1542]
MDAESVPSPGEQSRPSGADRCGLSPANGVCNGAQATASAGHNGKGPRAAQARKQGDKTKVKTQEKRKRTKKKKKAPPTTSVKLVVRLLPPELEPEEFWNKVKINRQQTDGCYYMKGKLFPTKPYKNVLYSRAYVSFKTAEYANAFVHSLKGLKFQDGEDDAGPMVMKSLFNKMPQDARREKSFEAMPEYLKFLQYQRGELEKLDLFAKDKPKPKAKDKKQAQKRAKGKAARGKGEKGGKDGQSKLDTAKLGPAKLEAPTKAVNPKKKPNRKGKAADKREPAVKERKDGEKPKPQSTGDKPKPKPKPKSAGKTTTKKTAKAAGKTAGKAAGDGDVTSNALKSKQKRPRKNPQTKNMTDSPQTPKISILKRE